MTITMEERLEVDEDDNSEVLNGFMVTNFPWVGCSGSRLASTMCALLRFSKLRMNNVTQVVTRFVCCGD